MLNARFDINRRRPSILLGLFNIIKKQSISFVHGAEVTFNYHQALSVEV